MSTINLSESLRHGHDAKSFVFGGHIGRQTKQTLEKQVRHMMNGANGQWILDTVAGLPIYWEALTQAIPEVSGTMQGARLLADLESWLRLGSASTDPLGPDTEIPDVWIGVLMILIQLDQYWRYLEFRFAGAADAQAELVKHHKSTEIGKVETVGFCAGMIAAVAVASSNNRRDFEKHGATAVRVGLLLGAIVGATEAWDKARGKGGSVSLAVAWRNSKQGNDMARIVSSLSPDAYVSVLFDDCRATVTTSERLVPKLVRQLRAAGVTAIPLAFRGKLHTPGEERERHVNALIEVCHQIPELQFPDAAQLALPTYIDHPEGMPISGQEVDLIGMVLRSVLASQLNWAATVSKLAANKGDVSLVAFGLDRPLPPTILRSFGQRQVQFDDIENEIGKLAELSPQGARNNISSASDPTKDSGETEEEEEEEDEDEQEMIAIVGMSLKTSGADDLDEFVDMIKTGESQHEVITRERMTYDFLWREPADTDGRKWYGNFMNDSDAFDHKFFKRSPRESLAIDPQGRHSMQAAYQAVAQSGYFTELEKSTPEEQQRRKHVGCYVGLCSFEYEINTVCHPPTAFTGTGALRSFIPGRVSHHFGWTGPAMTFDTACSSSTVALHNACRDVLSGEVPAALVGGVNVLTNLQWTGNLAAGSFISPSGQCKPFDADADGYCRGDAIAYVFLKKLSTAKADGNQILGVVRATGINQNLNTTPLFVPNVPSLSRLFKDVIRKANVEPRDISLVECHGTGTPVGDPAEWESVRQAVAGNLREDVVPIGSVKGHVGHTEGAAGLVSLIKVLMMMRGDFIPPQASFKKMNPNIHAKPSDNMEVVTSLRSWQGDRKVALINNYGACGSNATVVLSHKAHRPTQIFQRCLSEATTPRFPFKILGLDPRSVAAYSNVLAKYLYSHPEATIADVSFNLARQSNPNLAQGLIFSCTTLDELHDKLSQAEAAVKAPHNAASFGIIPVRTARPVVLCFGGQVSTFVGLDRTLYQSTALLRHHLDICDAAITSQGLDSIFPDIFSSEPIKDVVKLQTALFALQYSSAKSWMDSGLAGKVVSVVGHSFGEITALCVAGALSLQDTVKLISGRAKLVRDGWGPDPGAMIAVEGDQTVVDAIVEYVNRATDGSVSIACYNGARSFTLAASTRAIETLAQMLVERGLKNKRLNVTNAFHSTLVEVLVSRLDKLGQGLSFLEPSIPIERATENGDCILDSGFVSSQMRQPVFFHHALQRIVQKHSQAIFLEAGSNSTITVMASRALSAMPSDSFHFQSLSITNTKNGINGLTDAAVALWRQGLRVSFWAHHSSQTGDYAQLLLPPYQFEKSRHWLQLKSPTEKVIEAAQKLIAGGNNRLQSTGAERGDVPKPLGQWTFLGFQDNKKKTKLARFRINTTSEKYQRLFSTHVIAQAAPMVPATLEIDMAMETLFSLNPDWKSNGFTPVVRDMVSHSPICADSTRSHYIDLEPLNKAETEWSCLIHSVADHDATSSDKHAELRIHMYSDSNPNFLQEFGRYERMVSYAQCKAVLQLGPSDEGVEALQGRNVYRAFKEVVDFGSVYEGVKSVVGREGESAGIVQKRHAGDTWLDVPMADCFGQVAGMYVNLLTDIPSSDMFVATGLELVMRSPKAQTLTAGQENGTGIWHVLALHTCQSDKAYVTDVFIFDSETKMLREVILGLRYVRIAKSTMGKILTRRTTDKSFLRNTTAPLAAPVPTLPAHPTTIEEPKLPQNKAKKANTKKQKSTSGRDITDKVRNLVATVSGLEPSEMGLDAELADLGIDSLMGMELAREVESTFRCTLDHEEQIKATNLRQFVACVANALARSSRGGGVDQNQAEIDEGDSDENFSDESMDDSAVSGMSTPNDASSFSMISDAGLEPTSILINKADASDIAAREAHAEYLATLYLEGWESSALKAAAKRTCTAHTNNGAVVLVTGASGSLGSHLVASLADRPEVASVVCINRPVSNMTAHERQVEALCSRGIALSTTALGKLHVYDTDTSKPQLGLPPHEYVWLTQHGTHIIHNAWPMSATRPLKGFELQIKAMRNLMDLARDMASTTTPRTVGFQFVSSIGVTGLSAGPNVLEQPMPMASVIRSGYNEAKWVCERMLSDTLRRYPYLFRASVCRPGQITGSTSSGFWNPVEHFPFIVKSAQALKAWPDLQGVLHWLPVDRSAAVMVDLLKLEIHHDATAEEHAYPVYHIDNPVGQPWSEMSAILAPALDIPPERVIPFADWVQLVHESPLSEAENPAARLSGFLKPHFERMACGGIILDTQRAAEHSKTMAAEGPVSAELVRLYVSTWKKSGFLSD